jgi:transcriptional regulator with XRE-family HTH domain
MDSERLLAALKSVLRSKGISYKTAGEALGVSESSIKRLFADQSFTLPRLTKLCELAGIDFAELVRLADAATTQTDELGFDVEKQIVSDPKLLLVGVCVLNHCSFDEVMEKYNFTEHELIQTFAKLDRLGVIEFLPANRYSLKLSRRFRWQANGPLQNFFLNTIIKDYVTDTEPGTSSHLHFNWGMLTRESAAELHRHIQRLIESYVQIAEHDARLPMQDKMTSSLLVLFQEDWEPNIFKNQWR